ncbi:hypothetical protein [Pseudomonas sp. 210_17 TE3656]
MQTFRGLITVATMVAMLGAALDAGAVCNQSAASQADRDLWSTHGCWREFYLWEYQAYGLDGNDFTNRGWDDACNNVLEFPKHWNGAFLLTYGLLDNNDQSFHGTIDYRATAEAQSSNYHNAIHHTVADGTDKFGGYSGGTVTTYCPLYNPASANANPGSRGGDFQHEGWHAWLEKGNWDNGSEGGHRPGPVGSCTFKACDYFYFHGISEYVFGAMWEDDGTAKRFHSPNQVQVEYLCDVADQSKSWVPASVRLAAQTDANTRATARFINGPGYSCGSARPW